MSVEVLQGHWDVVEERPGGEGVPAGLVARGWDGFLLGLSDGEVEAHEIAGLEGDWGGAPEGLRALAAAAREVCALEVMDVPPMREMARKKLTVRKAAQVDAFAAVALPVARRAGRVLDVGCGHGHLTRELAERLELPVLGLERDAALAARARALPTTATAAPVFQLSDVLRDGLALRADDLVIGLHACGELGDTMVEAAARVGAALVLVGCCLQKRRGPVRRSLAGGTMLELPTALLGLSNLSPGDDGVETSRADNLAARQRRLALHHLLTRTAEPTLPLGAELDGLNRRSAQHELAMLAARAFALRALPPPTPADLAAAATWAAHHHARARRLALPRALLARVLEVHVLCDRALHLEQSGHTVRHGTLWPRSVSPRNLALLATRFS